MQIFSVVLRVPRFRPTSGKSWFSWRERPNHLCMSLMRVRSLLLDTPHLHSSFPSYQMQNFLLMQFFEKKNTWLRVEELSCPSFQRCPWCMMNYNNFWLPSEMPTSELPTSRQIWGRHYNNNPSSEMPTLVILPYLQMWMPGGSSMWMGGGQKLFSTNQELNEIQVFR